MIMHSTKLWPIAHSLGRSLSGNRGELVQQGIKTYNTTNYQSLSPWDNHVQLDHTQQKFWYNQPWRLGFFKNTFYRHISRNSFHKIENFNSCENETAHSILCSLPAYKFTTLNSDQCPSSLIASTSSATGTESTDHTALVSQFVKMSVNLSDISNEKDKPDSQLCSKVSKIVMQLPCHQLIKVLSSMTYWNTVHSKSKCYDYLFKSVSALDVNCFNNCTPQELLLAGDCFYSLGVSGPVFFALTRKLANLVPKLKPAEIVQYMFYTNVNRNRILGQDVLERRLVEEIHNFSPDELGIIAMGMFKTQSPIQSPHILNHMINVLKNADKLSSTSVGSLLKVIRYSLKFDDKENAYQALDNLSGKLDGMHTLALSQILLFGAVRQTFQPQVIDKAADLMLAKLEECRLKDIEKLLQSLLTFKFDSQRIPHVYERIISELCSEKRTSEINLYPLCFLSCLVQLTTANWYPVALLSAVFEPTVAQFCIDHGEGRKLNFLHWNTEIEGPMVYGGHCLTPPVVSELTQAYMCRIPTFEQANLTRSERRLLQIQEKLDFFLGEHPSKVVLILPQAQLPEIVFCTNYLGESVDIPPEYLRQSTLGIRRPVGKDIIYNAVMVVTQNQTLFPKDWGITGRAAALYRQLKYLGYKVTLIDADFFNRSNKSKFQKLENVLNAQSSLNTNGRSFEAFQNFTAKKNQYNMIHTSQSN